VKTLSPDDRRVMPGLEGCSVYAVASFYVRPDRLLVRAVRLVESAGGRVLDVDEERRVVRANLPVRAVERLSRELEELLSGSGVEVKVTCRYRASLGETARMLRRRGFLVELAGGRLLAYGVAGGRYVEVEVLEGRVRVKVGRRAAAGGRRLTSRPPPAAFVMSLGEAVEASREALAVAGAAVG